jgi:hypothetical protein
MTNKSAIRGPGLVDPEAKRQHGESLSHYLSRVSVLIRDFAQGRRRSLPDHAFNTYLRWFAGDGIWRRDWRSSTANAGFPSSYLDGFHLGGFGPPKAVKRRKGRARKTARKASVGHQHYKRDRFPKRLPRVESLGYYVAVPGSHVHFAHRPPPDVDIETVTGATRAVFRYSKGAMVSGDHKSPNAYGYSWYRRYFASGFFDDYSLNGSGAFGSDSGVIDTSGNGVPRVFVSRQTALYNNALDRLNSGSSESTSPYRSGTRGDLNLTIDLAEAHQTKRMLSEMSKVWRYVKSFGPARRFTGISTLGNKWLEYTYGIKPLVSSLFGAADELVRANINRVRTFTGSDTYRPSVQELPNLDIDGFFAETYGAMASESGVLKESVRLKIRMDVTDPAVNLLRWGTMDPRQIAWELMPYSFVVDWVYNVGSYLRNAETAAAYRNAYKDGFWSYLYVADVQSVVSRTSQTGGPFPILYVGSVSQLSFTRRFSRTVLLSYPAPRMPVLDVRLGWQRILSGAALARRFFH